MTAEIAVANANGIALAADSAATIHGSKVYNSANKLFALSKFEPVAIMIYGSSTFMGVPWEVLIKEFRTQLHSTHHGTLDKYSEEFWSYVRSRTDIFTEDVKALAIVEELSELYEQVSVEIEKKFESLEGEASMEELLNTSLATINSFLASLRDSYEVLAEFEKIQADDIIAEYPEAFENATKELQPLVSKLTEEQVRSLHQLGAEFLRRSLFSKFSGVVFAGYGRSEIYPRICSYQVSILVGDVLRLEKIPNLSNVSDDSFHPAIYPFAQEEMVRSFVQGISPTNQQRLMRLFDQIGDDWHAEALEKMRDTGTDVNASSAAALRQVFSEKGDAMIAELKSCISDSMSPIIKMLAYLQKDELAEMAESLVNLTAFKRKMSTDTESVGGPIDVAIVSKGDGFIWVKRKHYFKPELNPSFFKNYHHYRGSENEQRN